MAALRHLCQTGLHDLMGAHALDALALVQDVARFGVEQAGDGFQGGGLTGTVGTDQGHDLALVHLKRNILDSVDVAVINIDVINFQHRFCHRFSPPSCPGRPR